jgi:hypothetical protein
LTDTNQQFPEIDNEAKRLKEAMERMERKHTETADLDSNTVQIAPCPYCGLETGMVEADAAMYPDIYFSVVCPQCGARGPVHMERFDFDEAEIMARKLFAVRATASTTTELGGSD